MNAGQLPPAGLMTENRGPDSLEAQLRRLIQDYHLYGYRTLVSIGSEPGWPDWVIIGPNGIIFRELKSQAGSLSAAQRRVGKMLRRQGLDWAVWRPRDLLDGSVERRLESIAACKQEAFANVPAGNGPAGQQMGET